MTRRYRGSRSGVQEHLGPAILAGVELAIRSRRTLEGELVGDDERGLGASSDDLIPEQPVVALDRALPGSDGDSLLEGQAVGECDSAFLPGLRRSPGILRHIHTDNAD